MGMSQEGSLALGFLWEPGLARNPRAPQPDCCLVGTSLGVQWLPGASPDGVETGAAGSGGWQQWARPGATERREWKGQFPSEIH